MVSENDSLRILIDTSILFVKGFSPELNQKRWQQSQKKISTSLVRLNFFVNISVPSIIYRMSERKLCHPRSQGFSPPKNRSSFCGEKPLERQSKLFSFRRSGAYLRGCPLSFVAFEERGVFFQHPIPIRNDTKLFKNCLITIQNNKLILTSNQP